MNRFKRFAYELAGVFRLTIAQHQMSRKAFSKASKTLLSHHFRGEQKTDALIMAGNCSYWKKDFSKAVSLYERAIENEETQSDRQSQADSKYLIAYANLYRSAAEMRMGVNYTHAEIVAMKIELVEMDRTKTTDLAFSVDVDLAPAETPNPDN